MEYKSIRQTLAMSSSTAKPKDAAEEEYQKRLNGYSTYIKAHGRNRKSKCN